MQTVFDKTSCDSLVSRLSKISETTQPLWGKMNAAQMMHHLNLAMEAPLGKISTTGKPNFFMQIFKSVLYNDKPFGKGSPTPKDFKVTAQYNFNEEKQRALGNIGEIFRQGNDATYRPHVFFGKLTNDQWGRHFYKHTDHHLRQFGV